MQIQCKLITESDYQFCNKSRISWCQWEWCWRRSKATNKEDLAEGDQWTNEENIIKVDRHLEREWFEFGGLSEAFEKTDVLECDCMYGDVFLFFWEAMFGLDPSDGATKS